MVSNEGSLYKQTKIFEQVILFNDAIISYEKQDQITVYYTVYSSKQTNILQSWW